MRCDDHNIQIGTMQKGRLNKISDVAGVRVGHADINESLHKSGVTVIMPCIDSAYKRPLTAASFVLNGYGKTLGLVQIDELGTIETPIALTSTLNVGIVHDSIVGYVIDELKKDDIRLRTLNPVVCECNDSELNYNGDRPVKKEHVLEAIKNACADFKEGSVGAGTGTICHRLKGGIGSSSRVFMLDGSEYVLGVLAFTNQGEKRDLTINGYNIGAAIEVRDMQEKGSIILILATDVPLSSRQLKRVIKRMSVGLIRVGSHLGHGSGDIFVGFSTAESNRFDITDASSVRTCRVLAENSIDILFRAAAEASEEAILNSMLQSEGCENYEGCKVRSLSEYIDIYLGAKHDNN